MPKQKISAKELASDIRAGVNYRGLKTKFNLTETALDGAFQKLVTSGLVQYEELPENPSPRCPKCGMPQEQGEPQCRGCSIIREVFKGEDYQPEIALKDLVTDLKAKKGFEEVRIRHTLLEDQLSKILNGLLKEGFIKENETSGMYRSARSEAKRKQEWQRRVTIPTKESGESVESEDFMFCPKCGQKRAEGANFCSRCGNAFKIFSAETVDGEDSSDTTGSPEGRNTAAHKEKYPPRVAGGESIGPTSLKEADHVLVWLIAFSPCFGVMLDLMRAPWPLWVVFLLSQIALFVIDVRRLQKAGYDTKPLATSWIVPPVYLFKRVGVVGGGSGYAVCWLITFFCMVFFNFLIEKLTLASGGLR